METESSDPKKALLIARLIFFAIVAGSIGFLIVVFNIKTGTFFFKTDFSDPLILALMIMTFITIPSGFIFSRANYKKADSGDSIIDKFRYYQAGLIVRMASCEGIAIFSMVVLLLTNNMFTIIFFMTALIVMLAYYPTPEKIGKDFNLTQAEIEKFY